MISRKLWRSVLIGCSALIGCAQSFAGAIGAETPPKYDREMPPGFVSLLDGTLRGWQGTVSNDAAAKSAAQLDAAQAAANQSMRDHWYVDHGVLRFDGSGSNIRTAREYGDFELIIDWRIESGGDSGIYLRGFPQVQIWDNPIGSGGLYNNKKHDSSPRVKADRAAGEWNRFFIRMIDDRVTVFLNGMLVVDNVIFENSTQPNQPLPSHGPVELQAHGTPLWFRNVAIHELRCVSTDVAMGAIASPPATSTQAPPQQKATTVAPAPRDESWKVRHNAIVEEARKGSFELAFLGDSITEGWAGAGREIWEKRFAPLHAINLGIGGDRTQHILWRLDNGLLDALSQNDPPNHIKAVVLMIGTNNSNGNDNTAEEIAAGIKAIVAELRDKLSHAKILLLAIFPRGEKPNAQRDKNAKASEIASHFADGKSVYYLDIGQKFLSEDGTLSKEIMPDLLHLSPRGYQIWADAIERQLTEMLK